LIEAIFDANFLQRYIFERESLQNDLDTKVGFFLNYYLEKAVFEIVGSLTNFVELRNF
jgi:hypothetical protein